MDREKIIAAVGDILEAIGENPQREGLLRTPERVADMYAEILDGIAKDPKAVSYTQLLRGRLTPICIKRRSCSLRQRRSRLIY